jgi:teichuronic acid biosynthesis glycosyltransferase TuaG
MFSVVMPAFNASDSVEASIRSVQSQTDEDWELLVVDDRSTDDTAAVVERIAALDARVRLMRHLRNSGVAEARNTALRAARGRYIAFLDSDDIWYCDKLAIQRARLDEGVGVVHGSYHRVLRSGNRSLVRAIEVVTPRTFLHYNPIGNLTGAYDRRLGIVLQRAMRHEDYMMWYELVSRAGRSLGTLEPLGGYLVRGTSLSGNKLRAAAWHWRVLRDGMGQPLHSSVYGFCSYALRSMLQRAREGPGT